MKSIIGLIFTLILINNAYSIDYFNTYRWNRANELEQNGKIDKGPWYEWWYYKVVLPNTNESFFFVYGVVNPWDQEQEMKGTRAYIGMGDFQRRTQPEEKFDVSEFMSSYQEPYVAIQDNFATDKYISGSLKDEDGKNYEWQIDIKKNWTFNATGWATGRMITNIEWYPAQADATCSGKIISHDKTYNFTDVPCYQDRNWGTSFPKWWTWIVSNHFENNPGTTLAIGGGRPIFRGGIDPIENVAIGFKHKGQEYSFRPNDLDIVRIDINFGKWEASGINGNTKIEVSAFAPKESFMDLIFMTPEGKEFHDYETLTGKLTVKLYKRKHLFKKWELIDTVISNHAGIEYGSHDEYDKEKLFNSNNKIFSTF